MLIVLKLMMRLKRQLVKPRNASFYQCKTGVFVDFICDALLFGLFHVWKANFQILANDFGAFLMSGATALPKPLPIFFKSG